MQRHLSVARDLPSEEEVNMTNQLELLSLKVCMEGELAGKRPSLLPYLPPTLAKNAQMVLVEGNG